MYDRKTWIVLAICGSLLAIGFQQSNESARDKTRQEKLQQEKSGQASAAKGKSDPDTPPPDTAVAPVAPGLTEDLPPPPTEEEFVSLQTDKVSFVFSNIGGGIKYAEFKTEFQVGKQKDCVRINERGAGPIGGLAGTDETLENLCYSYNQAESIPGEKIVYSVKLTNGLLVKKIFSLVKAGVPCAQYLLNFELQFENASTTACNL